MPKHYVWNDREDEFLMRNAPGRTTSELKKMMLIEFGKTHEPCTIFDRCTELGIAQTIESNHKRENRKLDHIKNKKEEMANMCIKYGVSKDDIFLLLKVRKKRKEVEQFLKSGLTMKEIEMAMLLKECR